MAVGFIQLNENDTKELRKEIGLPVTTSEDYSISNVNNKDELVEVGDLDEGWQGKLLSRFGKLEREFGLMEHSFSIMANAGKMEKYLLTQFVFMNRTLLKTGETAVRIRSLRE